MDVIASAAEVVHRKGFRWKCRREVKRLRSLQDSAASLLADALEAALHDDAGQHLGLQRVEVLRQSMQRSNARVSFHDYGRGHRWKRSGSVQGALVTRRLRDVCRSSSPPHEALVLYHLIRRFQPAACLELGTCLGISAAYQATALDRNGTGRLITLEGGKALARMAREHLKSLGLQNTRVVEGPFAEALPVVLAANEPIDFAFIDGHHDPAATLDYVERIAPHLAHEALLVIDDISWTTGMRKAWHTLKADRRMRVTTDLITFGICYFRADRPQAPT